MKPILLLQHPQSSSSIPRPWVRFGRDGEILRLTFRIPGDTSGIFFPAQIKPGVKQNAELRTDRLWEHTCFEVFLKLADGPEYVEFNFSPSGEWAAYSFDGYRSGMRNSDVAAPAIISTDWSNRFELSALIALPMWKRNQWAANFSAVVEQRDGTKSYWALAHPSGPPDFHDPSCFLARLPE